VWGSSFVSAAIGPFERGGSCSHQPRVDRNPLTVGVSLNAGLEVLGKAQVDP
jgi:hypothetical protein